VSNAFQIRNVYNFPNPFSSFTNFTFILLASDNVQSCKIKIYTVAGRLVKEISTYAKVGFNQIYWDGRDNDGDVMANGVYLYKIILDDGSKTTTQIQKIAILK
jgi:flagellar hook assembly protein FlgD